MRVNQSPSLYEYILSYKFTCNSGILVRTISSKMEITVHNWTTEALLNLVKNCSEHTPGGGSITIACDQNPICTQIVVEDTGSGFIKEDTPHLFERFL